MVEEETQRKLSVAPMMDWTEDFEISKYNQLVMKSQTAHVAPMSPRVSGRIRDF